MTPSQATGLLEVLKKRFDANMNRHKTVTWPSVHAKLEADPSKLRAIAEMERTGGEPDVIAYDESTDEYLFCDCSTESPAERRSCCFDREGLESRKEHQPKSNAIDMASEMGIEMLDAIQYRELQKLGTFDQKTSSWIKTPAEIRKLGGALFCDYRYGKVFVYHNGAQSYYASRGFRGLLKV
ncbi:DUF4256 domain-containing protein [Flavobacterium selenitireducens]|uniref:DUF4256 domain-containing protein n=1 Tax=Flavobacterium selenitireducens TaxID=2722704 RepID=UPI00168B83D8|nr:DUF4256 domain-containing protein [Flavobacterium selenitireducens]MBD3583927.1 DUF4256 domain-containing protein [Flavobacterium selenitireducens]